MTHKNRNQNKFLKRNQTQKEIMDAVDKKNPLSGNYDTRDKRLIKKQEFANVNFSMGNDTSKSKNLQISIFDILFNFTHEC